MSGSGYIRFLHNTAGMATVNSYTRRPQRYRKPPPEFVPLPPSAEYIALSEIPSVPLLSDSDKPESRKLLVLDLNGTLVLRSPRSYSGPRTVMPRPFSKTFKDHLDVMVWSSAQPHSVHSMLGSFFGPDRNRLVGIWARDTLGLRPEHYNDPTSIPGYDPSKPPPESKTMIYTSLQLMPESVQENSETDRTGYFEIPEVKKDDPIPGLSSIDPDAGAVQPVLPVGPYSALNSLLLDDSALKAHLQPYNHLTLPEYTADLRARDVRRQEAIEALANAETMTLETGIDEDSKESDGLIEKGGRDMGGKFTESEGEYLPILARSYVQFNSQVKTIGVKCTNTCVQPHTTNHFLRRGMRPNEEEMQKVAALFLQDNQDRRGDSDGRLQDTGYDRDQATLQAIPIKRSSDSLIGAEQSSPKRPRPDLPRADSPLASSAEQVEEEIGTIDEPEAHMPIHNQGFNSGPEPRSIEDDPAAHFQIPFLPTKPHVPAFQAQAPRTRQKPTYPIDHPLSANDPYPFFTDGKPETKLWFQDRDTYTYWVRRGLLALKECKIEPEAGVEVDI
ncbi:NLI interacting factor-like phosphatase [Rhizoctonia solani]|uniref:NLI interacting factor-like phosphatase n=1 Tax=Rhizoctonia solani TaxID=456999 RepID=A0A8H7IA34_9AGAM|nr:NLI interacting factor-like phosphatase [Rhizoctonia solani]